MRLIYISSAGNSHNKGSSAYVLASAVVRDINIQQVTWNIRTLMGESGGLPWDNESGKTGAVLSGALLAGNCDAGQCAANSRLIGGITKIIKSFDIRIFAAVIRKNEHYRKYLIPEPVDMIAAEKLALRCEEYLGRARDQGMLILGAGEENARVSKCFSEWLLKRWMGYQGLPNIVENPVSISGAASAMTGFSAFCADAVLKRYEQGWDEGRGKIWSHFKVRMYPE